MATKFDDDRLGNYLSLTKRLHEKGLTDMIMKGWVGLIIITRM